MKNTKTILSTVIATFALSAAARAIDPGALTAEPVWPAGRECERNLFVGFRARFDGAKARTLRYCASSIARVWLNGRFLAYGPARGPHGLDRMDEIPLADAVTNGLNTLAIEVAGYNVESFYLLNEPAYLLAEVTDDAGRPLVATSAANADFEAFVLSERIQKVPRFSYQRPFCEIYSLSPSSCDWRTGAVREPRATLARVTGSPITDRVFPYPDYTVSSVFRPVAGGRLERRTPEKLHDGRSVTGEKNPKRGYAAEEIAIQPVREIQCLPVLDRHPVAGAGAYPLAEKSYVLLDHGLNDTGFLGARVVCRKPGRVYFHFDEVLVNGDIDVSRMGWQCVNAVTYDFREPGVYDIEAFEPNTFRYLKVMSDTFEGEVSGLFVRAYKNAGAKAAEFRSTDAALDKIFAAAKETFVQNAVDAFTDCPSRERAGWLCDSFFSARVAALLTGDTSVERGFLQNYAKCPKTLDRGFLPMCYPADAGLLPNWNFWLILELEEYLARSGDRALVDEMKPKVMGIVEAFRHYRNSDGLLERLPGWVFIEWSHANKLVRDVNYPSNMTWAEVLDAVARLYGLGDCAEEARRVRETVRRQSWTGEWFCDNAVRQKDGSLKLSGECTETCQYYAFFFKTATPETHPQLWARLLGDFGPKRKQTKAHPQIFFANAFIGNYLRLELLSRARRAQQILDETKGYFLGMAEKTGTLWEHDNAGNSCDHGFASHVAVVLVRDVFGADIDPRTCAISYRPTDATLEGADVRLPTVRGDVALSARKGGRVAYGQPLVVDFGPQGKDGAPVAVVSSVAGSNVKLRLSCAADAKGRGETFGVAGPGFVRCGKAVRGVRYVRLCVETPGAAVDVNRVVLESASEGLPFAIRNGAKKIAVRAVAGECARVSKAGGAVQLEVVDPKPNKWPAVYFNFDGYCDLDAVGEVRVRVKNPLSENQRISVKVKAVTPQGQMPAGGRSVGAGMSRTIRVPLKIEDYVFDRDPHLKGLKRHPRVAGGSSYTLAKTYSISVFLDPMTAGGRFLVESVEFWPKADDHKVHVLKADELNPWVDEFGQAKFAEFPAKIHGVGDFKTQYAAEMAELEAKPEGIPDVDEYGGWKGGPQLKATGHFRTEKVNGKWWLVDPAGHLYFAQGLNCGWDLTPTAVQYREEYFEKLPPKEGATKQFWTEVRNVAYRNYYSDPSRVPYWAFSFQRQNLWYKYGDDYLARNREMQSRRCHAWGINCLTGADRELRRVSKIPYHTGFSARARPIATAKGYWGELIDPFAPEFETNCLKSAQNLKYVRDDPWCVGCTVDNELSWGANGLSLAKSILQAPDDQPAKIALVKMLAERGKTPETATDDDCRALGQAVSDRYYSTIRRIIKSVAPDMLYLGDRNDKRNPETFIAASRHCDVVTVNTYDFQASVELPKGAEDRPLWVTEFHFGCYDTGYFYASLIPVASQKVRANCYLDYLHSAIDSPNYVGANWFCWRDQPITGVIGESANSSCGVVSVTDIPYRELTGAMKRIAGEMYARRYGSGPRPSGR